jgi:uncharacterized protein YndB with AHSA1/START domain
LSDQLGIVFGALADPSRRQVIGYLSERGTATATELDPERRLAFEWDDEGEVEFTLDDDGDGTRLTVTETDPAWTTALELQASAFSLV